TRRSSDLGLLGKPQKYGGGAPERTSPAPINRDVSLKRVLGCCDATSATGYGLTLGVPARCRAWYRSSVSGANARRHSIAASPSTPPPTGSAPGRARDSCAGRAAGGCRRRRRSRPKGWQGGPPATASTAPTKDQGLAASAGLRAKTCQGDFRENNSARESFSERVKRATTPGRGPMLTPRPPGTRHGCLSIRTRLLRDLGPAHRHPAQGARPDPGATGRSDGRGAADRRALRSRAAAAARWRVAEPGRPARRQRGRTDRTPAKRSPGKRG